MTPRDTTSSAAEIVRQNIEHHDLDAPMYDLSHPNLHHLLERRRLRADLELLAELLGDRRPVRAVDVGSGTGRLTVEFLRRGWEVTAVDSSEGMQAALAERCRRLGNCRGTLAPVLAGADDFLAECRDQFDLFAFSSVLHHLPDPVGVVRACARLLVPGGCIYITQEPLPATGTTTPTMRIGKALDEIARVPQQLYRDIYRRAKGLPVARAGELVDVHVATGLDLSAIEQALAEAGVERRRFVTYADRKTALVAWLDEQLFRTPNRYFRYIGRRAG